VRWFWSITAFHVDPTLGINTNGRVPTLEEAKAQFKSSWERVRAASKLGNVKATSREAAESEAARLFSLSDFHRRRLLLDERLRNYDSIGRW
jgi:hypothetical protein